MFRLSTPLVFAELGWMAMAVVDTMFVGRVSAEAMGAVSLGAMLFYTLGVFASGLLLGLDTLIANAFGAGERDDYHRSFVNGVWLALFLIPTVMTMVWFLTPRLATFGIDPGILDAARPYIRALNYSTAPLLLFFAFRRYLQAVGGVRPIMFTLISANVVNAIFNWLLVFGNLGLPRLGAEGSGWATFISRIYMMAVLGLVILRRDPGLLQASWRPYFPRLRQLLRLGIPAAGQIGLEFGVFATVTVLVAKLDAVSLAGHQIALTTVSTTYMMPLGISSAAAVCVGQEIGRGDPSGAARSGWVALGIGAMLMCASAVTLLTIPQLIARAFTSEGSVVAAAVNLLRVAAFFQLFDGLQVVATGALRGFGDTRTPMLCHFVGYWLIGLPLGALLCFREELGAVGLWVGLSIGLILIGVALLAIWRHTASGLHAEARMMSRTRSSGMPIV